MKKAPLNQQVPRLQDTRNIDKFYSPAANEKMPMGTATDDGRSATATDDAAFTCPTDSRCNSNGSPRRGRGRR